MRLFALLALALLVSGCMQSSGDSRRPDGTQTTSSTTTSPTSSATSTTGTQPMPSAPPLEAFLSNCEEWTTGLVGPTETFGGPLPAGWESSGPAAWQLIQFDQCDRLSWGRFERGPVHLIFEFSEDFTPPDSCMGGDPGRMHILRALWVDDPEVADWLRTTYGMPTRSANITVSATNTPAAITETWSWSESTSEPSTILFQRPAAAQDTPLEYRHRFFWFTPSAAAYADLDESFLNDDYASPVVHGTLQEPMMYAASTGVSEYDAGVDRSSAVNTSAAISLFKDFACTRDS